MRGQLRALAFNRVALNLDQGGVTFNGDNSTLHFVGSKVTGSHDGGFKNFDGSITLDGKMLKAVTVDIKMDSTFSDHPKLTGHLMSPDFFDVANHPKTTFVSTAIEEGGDGGATHIVKGNLTLRGQTKAITFPVNVKHSDGSVNIKSEFSINRKDFGIKYPGKPDDLIRDDVLMKLDINAKT